MPPSDDFDPPVGAVEVLEPGIRRVLAPNPSPMTYRGTNTYIVGRTDLAVIDPGPDSDDHLAAILSAVAAGQRVSHILVSHAHLDHAPLARRLSDATGAPVMGFGPAHAGRSQIMQRLAATEAAGGGEGVDHAFVPDVALDDGAEIEGPDWRLRVLHTPGHIGNHLCFAMGDICFTADHVMGWSTSLVSPPDGDLSDFMASCARLSGIAWRVFYPGHGAPVFAPNARLSELVAHRRKREREILAVLDAEPASAREIARSVYTEIPQNLLPAAARNVLAHLVDLAQRGEVLSIGPLTDTAVFERRRV
jgi:glyoxylase-like metal-dependent hydrolase (beta-lactamase superfamily II)